MAGQDRGSSADLKADLLSHPHAFSFFQVVRLLRLWHRPQEATSAADLGGIRVRPELSLAFPASDVVSVQEVPGRERFDFLVTATFLGLYGSSSPLPTFYTEDLLDEAAADESVTRDFLDVVNAPLFTFLYRCWGKYRQVLQVVEEGSPDYGERLYCLLGLGEKELRDGVPGGPRLLRYIGLFTQFPRSALGLKTLLADALGGVPVEVVPCLLRRVKIPMDQRSVLGQPTSTLTGASFLGEEVEDRSGKFRLRIGPLKQQRFQALFPGMPLYQWLTFLTRLYVTDSLEYDLEVVLARGEVSNICLGAPEWSRLGLDTWVFSGELWEEVQTTFQPKSL
jgi:type VI secretion system protein ImpH